MVKVEMLVDTFYYEPLKKGGVIDVDSDVAERWVRNNIAKIVDKQEKTGRSKKGSQNDA